MIQTLMFIKLIESWGREDIYVHMCFGEFQKFAR